MANRFCVVNNGNSNDTATWSETYNGAGGASVPVAGDVAMANGKTVLVVANLTCVEVRSDTTGSAVNGGKFLLSDGVTLTANVYPGTTPAHGYCVEYAGSAPNSANFVGAVNGASASSGQYPVVLTGSGTLNVTGSTTMSAAGGNYNIGVVNAGIGTINITGNCTGVSGNDSVAVHNGTSGTLNITGNCVAGYGTRSYGVRNISSGAVVVNGNSTAHTTGTASHGAYNTLAGPMTINGWAIASTINNGVYNAGTGILSIKSIQCGSNGFPGFFSASTVRTVATTGLQWKIRDNNLNEISLYSEETLSDYPNIANVRHGTVFGNGNLTGTCYVPAASNVAVGIPVDNTVGTAIISAAGLLSALGMNSGNMDTQIASLASSLSTLLGRIIGTLAAGTHQPQGGDAFARLGAPVGASISVDIAAKLATSSYTAPDNAGITAANAAIAALHDFDPATDTVARVTLVDTATTLTNAPSAVTAQDVWEYVSTLLPAGAEAMLAGISARMAEQVPAGPVVVLPAPAAGQTIAWVMCYGPNGALEAGVTVSIFLTKTTEDGAFDAAAAVLTSDANGLAQGPIPRGAGHSFKARRGKDGKLYAFAGVDADSLALPPLLGSP